MRVTIEFEPDSTPPQLEIPWESTVSGRRYLDLRENPQAVELIEPARLHPPLRTFLAALNGAESMFTSVRSATHAARRPNGGADVFEFSSLVDVVFLREESNFTRSSYESLTDSLRELLNRDPSSETLRAELRVRLCRFHGDTRRGYALEVTLAACGATPEQAELRWSLGLVRVQQALLFLSRAMRHLMSQAN